MGIQKVIVIIILIIVIVVYVVQNRGKKEEAKKSYQELRDEAMTIMNALEVDHETKKKLIYALNTKRKQLERMQDAMKFLLANGLKL